MDSINILQWNCRSIFSKLSEFKHNLSTLPNFKHLICLHQIFNTLQKNLAEDYFTCFIFLELSKAFDTVNHKILINKMNSYGIRSKMQSLLSNYLTNHNQYTQCNSIESKVNPVYCAYPETLR